MSLWGSAASDGFAGTSAGQDATRAWLARQLPAASGSRARANVAIALPQSAAALVRFAIVQ